MYVVLVRVQTKIDYFLAEIYRQSDHYNEILVWITHRITDDSTLNWRGFRRLAVMLMSPEFFFFLFGRAVLLKHPAYAYIDFAATRLRR